MRADIQIASNAHPKTVQAIKNAPFSDVLCCHDTFYPQSAYCQCSHEDRQQCRDDEYLTLCREESQEQETEEAEERSCTRIQALNVKGLIIND